MKKGQTIMIYTDPETKSKKEGNAKLLKLLKSGYQNNIEYWTVKFLSDGFICNRFVSK